MSVSVSRWLSLSLVASALAVGCAAGDANDDSTDDGGIGAPHADAAHDAKSGDAATDTGGGELGDGSDDATSDAGSPDTSAPDANVSDTSAPDGNIPDINVPDTNMSDTNVPDTNVPDTNVADTNVPDTNIPDTNVPDTNVPDTSTPDAGSCPPVLSGFTPVFHAAPTNTHACTTASIQSFYDQCLNGSSCAAWQTSASTACKTCLLGHVDAAGTQWGPVVQYAAAPYVYSNQGGCVSITNPTATTCAHDIEALLECTHAACDVGCTGAPTADYDACTSAAQSGVCASYVTAETADCANVSSVCFGGTDFESNFKQVASVFCQ